MSLKIDRKGAGLGFCFTRNGENWLLRRQTVACPEKILKSLRYWANVQYRHMARKAIMEIPALPIYRLKHPRIRLLGQSAR
jgi:hypothetical protein